MNVNLYSLIDTAVKDRIQNGIASVPLPELKSVHSQIFPDISTITDADLPAVSVVEWGEAASFEGNSSESTAAWVSLLALILDKTGDTPAPHANKATYLKIQKAIADLFRTPKSGTYDLGGVPEVKRCMVFALPFFDRRMPMYHNIMMGVGLRFWAPEEGV